MPENVRTGLEAILYAYACDKITSKAAQRQCRLYGYAADLRSNPESNRIEVMHIESGDWYWVEV